MSKIKLPYFYVNEIRDIFSSLLQEEIYTSVNREKTMTSLVGNETIEIVNANFVVNLPVIFGTINQDYVKREEEWYNSQSLNVNDIPGGTPSIWKAVADKDGFINSNYGWCIYSPENVLPTDQWELIPGNPWYPRRGFEPPTHTPLTKNNRTLCQYNLVLEELLASPESRRAIMIYTRPNMWLDYNKNSRSDFMCTNNVQYIIRNGMVDAIVNMRSNDSIAGFKNDSCWQKHVLEKLTKELNEVGGTNYKVGDLHWNAGSLHVYSRHFYLVDHYSRTGEFDISKEKYKELYPHSKFL